MSSGYRQLVRNLRKSSEGEPLPGCYYLLVRRADGTIVNRFEGLRGALDSAKKIHVIREFYQNGQPSGSAWDHEGNPTRWVP